MPAAQLYFTGVTSTFNPHRMIFNKVTDSGLILASGEVEPIDKDRLYRVVTGLYCGQMLGAVNEKSFGILSITPRDADGNVVEDIETCIIHDENGREIKEWYALTAYLQQMGTVDEKYSDVQGYKNIVLSKKPADLLRGANKITILAIAIVVVLIAVIVLVICLSVRRRKLRKAGKLKKRSGRK